jgi:hypothetical protein
LLHTQDKRSTIEQGPAGHRAGPRLAGRGRPPREDPAHVGDGSRANRNRSSSGPVCGTSCTTSSTTSSTSCRPCQGRMSHARAPAQASGKPCQGPMSHARARHRAPAQDDIRLCQGQMSHMPKRHRPKNALPVMPKWRRIEAEKIFSRELRSLAESSRAEGHLASEVTPLFRPTPRGKGRPASGSTSPIPQQPPLIQNQYPFQKPAQHTPN